MVPTLSAGTVVMVDPNAYGERSPVVGDIVIAFHPHQPELQIVKRVAAVTAQGAIVLHSDNPAVGTDSRSFGALPMDRISGRVTSRLTP